MLYTGHCPKCEQGLLGIRICSERPLLVCDECEALWMSPDTSQPARYPQQPESLCPQCGESIWGSQAYWASRDDASAFGWASHIQGELERSHRFASQQSVASQQSTVAVSDDNGSVVDGSESKTVRWGILGTARIANKVGAAIRRTPGAELTLIGSRSADKAKVWSLENDAVRSVGSYQQVLEDPQIDAVYIPLPPSLHHQWTLKAARAGKHVLCEKPFAMNVKQAEEMLAACREHNVQLMDGVMWYHHPRGRAMQQVITSGQLGDLRRVQSAFTFRRGKLDKDNYRTNPNLGGGALGDLGWYNVGVSLWAFGQTPVRVMAHSRMYKKVDFVTSATLSFGDPRQTATFDCGYDTTMRKWVEISGNESVLLCDDFVRPGDAERPTFRVLDREGASTEHVANGPIQEDCMIAEFVRLVQAEERDWQWAERAIATQRVCDAIRRSAKSGREKPV